MSYLNGIIFFQKKGGIYTFLINGNKYIGSAKDLYLILNVHLSKKPNRNLHFAIEKHGFLLLYLNILYMKIRLLALNY